MSRQELMLSSNLNNFTKHTHTKKKTNKTKKNSIMFELFYHDIRKEPQHHNQQQASFPKEKQWTKQTYSNTQQNHYKAIPKLCEKKIQCK
jgi:hypothetical protein